MNECDQVQLDWQFMMKNENNNDLKFGRIIQCKIIKFWKKINREKKLLEWGFSKKQSWWRISVKIYFSSS